MPAHTAGLLEWLSTEEFQIGESVQLIDGLSNEVTGHVISFDPESGCYKVRRHRDGLLESVGKERE